MSLVTSRFVGAASRVARLAPLVAMVALAGCEEPPLEYREVKRVHELVSPEEARSFLAVVESLPGGKLPPFESVFGSPPDWSELRTLPVSSLVTEEQARLADRWAVSRLSAAWDDNPRLERALRKNRMTRAQFAGLSLALGAALSRSAVRENQPLPPMREKGVAEVALLREDARSFASLSEDVRHSVLQRSIWITRHDRAVRLLQVPKENVALVRSLGERLSTAFPDEFTSNPFDGIADLLEESGLPFVELSSSGRDDELDWRRDDALIGRDAPDGDE